MNTIKSKFRRQFLFKLIFEFLFSLFFIILILYLGYRWRGFQLDNSLMWLGVMISIMLIIGFYQFFIYPLKLIEVTENEILVRFLIAPREVQIPYSAKNEQYFAREVNYLITMGVKDFEKIGLLWKAKW